MRSSLAVHHPGHHHHHHHAGSAPVASEAFSAYRPSAGLTAGEPTQPQSRPAGAPVHHASASIDKYREYGSGGLGVSRRPRGPGGPHPASEKLRRLLREPRARLQQHLHASLGRSSNSTSTPSGGRAEELHPAMRGVLKPLRTEAVANWIRKTQMSDRHRRVEQELVSSFTRVASGKRELSSSGGHQHRYPRHPKQHAGGDTVPTSSSSSNNDSSSNSSSSNFRSAYPPPGERAIAALARGTVLRPTPVRMSVAISAPSYTGPVKIPLCGDLRCRVRSCYTWPRMYSCFLSGELRKVGVEIDAVVHSGHPADLKDTNENASRPSVIRTSHSSSVSKPRDVIVLDDGDDSTVDTRPPTSAPAATASRHSSHRALAAIRSPLAPPSIRNAIRDSSTTQSLLHASGQRVHGSSHSSSRSSSLLSSSFARAPSTADSSAPLELTSPASRLSVTHAVPSSITSVANPHYLPRSLQGPTITSPLALTTLTSSYSSSKPSASMAFTSTRALDLPPARIDLTSASSLSILSRAPDLPTPRLESTSTRTSPMSPSNRAPELTSSHAPPLAISNRAPSDITTTSRSPPSLSPSAPPTPPSPDEVQDLSSSSGTATSAPATSYRDEEQSAPLLELSEPPRITISCAEGAMTLYRGSESPGLDVSVIAPTSV